MKWWGAKGDYQSTQLEFIKMQALLGSTSKRSHRQKATEQKLQETKASWRKRGEGGKGNESLGVGVGDTQRSELDKGWAVKSPDGNDTYPSKSLWDLIFWPKEDGATNTSVRMYWRLRHTRSSHFLKRTEVRDSKHQEVNLLCSSLLSRFLQFLCCCHSIILWLLGSPSIPNY